MRCLVKTAAMVALFSTGMLPVAQCVDPTIREMNSRLLEANSLAAKQAYLAEVAFFADHYPDTPPPKPRLIQDPMAFFANKDLLDTWVMLTAKWEKTHQKKAEQEADAEFNRQVAASREKRDRVYPEALNPNHPIHDAAEKIWTKITESNNPLVNDPDAPFKVYEMAARQLGIKPLADR